MAGPREKALRVEAEEAKRRKARREEELRAARLRRAEARRERQAALQRRLAREILFAGRGVSQALTDTASDADALAQHGLPLLRDAADLAELLEVDMGQLRWLTYHRDVARVVHYRQFQIPKAKGGQRTISAPRPHLRAALQRIRSELLAKLEPSGQAQAFVTGRSTVSNATPHVGRGVVVKVDLVDFFGALTYPRVRGWWRSLGYSGMVASLLGLLTTEAKRVEVELDGRRLWVATGPRSLPQGAPTSPELTNQLARGVDRRLAGYAAKHGWVYTRYADDLTFSHADNGRDHVGKLLGVVRAVVEGEGFAVNGDKLFVARRGRQQRVTGIVVNDQPGIDRRTLRRFRAAVHRVSKDGFRDGAERSRMLGYASYVRMVKPALGQRWLEALNGVDS